jgi:hypothetical protein
MYQIDKNQNQIQKLEEKSFSELGFKEREHLQEWIAKDPSCLADEELLIIQKEFAGFHETRERLDLLALDKQGNLVIIENKLDDSGRDVTWQVIKYASYCSSLSKDDVKDIYQKYLDIQGEKTSAEDALSDFLGIEDYAEAQVNNGYAQRIILIAADFRKEVTSTVLWLMNFKMRIQCFKVTPFVLGEQLFLNFDQILPVKDAQDYAISMASKAQEEIATQENLKSRHHQRIEFWTAFLKKSNAKNDLFNTISPSKDNWLALGIGLSGVSLNPVVAKTYARVEIYISTGSKELNKRYYDFFEQRKAEIEAEFGGDLTWERLDDKKASRIKSQLNGVSLYEKEDWNRMFDFMISASERMEKAFKEPLKQLKAGKN